MLDEINRNEVVNLLGWILPSCMGTSSLCPSLPDLTPYSFFTYELDNSNSIGLD